MVRFLQKFLELVLVLGCLAAMGGGIYYYITVSGAFRSEKSPKVYNAVVIVVTAPFQPLVIYPNNQRTGYDPETRSDVNEISKSRYYFQTEEGAPDPGTYWLGLTDPPDNFNLKIFGRKGEYYSFGFYSFEKGIQQTQTISGRFTSDIVQYKVVSTPKKSFPWDIKPE